MSINYHPELVRLLMEERLREAREARLAEDLKCDPRLVARPSRFAGLIGRTFAARAERPVAAATAPVACTC
jgi:hypothetical protein